MRRRGNRSSENRETEQGVGSDGHGRGAGTFEYGGREGLDEKVTLEQRREKPGRDWKERARVQTTIWTNKLVLDQEECGIFRL